MRLLKKCSKLASVCLDLLAISFFFFFLTEQEFILGIFFLIHKYRYIIHMYKYKYIQFGIFIWNEEKKKKKNVHFKEKTKLL